VKSFLTELYAVVASRKSTLSYPSWKVLEAFTPFLLLPSFKVVPADWLDSRRKDSDLAPGEASCWVILWGYVTCLHDLLTRTCFRLVCLSTNHLRLIPVREEWPVNRRLKHIILREASRLDKTSPGQSDTPRSPRGSRVWGQYKFRFEFLCQIVVAIYDPYPTSALRAYRYESLLL
jgi:hypothetical protein